MILEDKEIFGCRFRVVVPASIGYPRHTTAEFDEHEPVMERWVQGINVGDLVIDGGASFGNYTLTALEGGASVIAYEPYHEHAECLRANVAANGWEARCVIREVGLWNGTPYPEGILRQMQMPLDMPTVRLDDDFAVQVHRLTFSPKGKFHIKLDIEGTELGALQGAPEFLRTHHPRLIIEDHESVSSDPNCEISRYPERIQSRKGMRAILGPLGYVIEDVPFDVSRHYLCATQP
jgi:FkbM family methyltransferase